MPELLIDARQRKAILDELVRILQSSHFRTSRRSQQFLQYVVERTLDGALELLKERAIGMALFDRAPDYDTGEDAAARVAANEVRKRLAQYYLAAPALQVRISLPPGGYHAEFQWASVQPEPRAPAAAPDNRRRRWALAAVLAMLVAVSLFLMRPSSALRENTAFEQFWAPLLESRRPVLICLAHPLVYLLADPLPPLSPQGVKPAPPDDPLDLRRRGLVESRDQYVGVGDALTTARLAALFAGRNKPFQIRIGFDVSFADLRESAAVLVGAYSNRWTMQVNAEYRFAFARYSIVDRQQPGRAWQLDKMRPGYRTDEDYLLISRILSGYSGEPLVMAAGITHAGTQAAGELLTRPTALEEMMRGAPPDWPRKNLQIVLHCKVVGTTPRPPRVVASGDADGAEPGMGDRLRHGLAGDGQELPGADDRGQLHARVPGHRGRLLPGLAARDESAGPGDRRVWQAAGDSA